MIEQTISPKDVDEAIQKLRFPKPKVSSDEAAKKAVAMFLERPEPQHCAPSTIIALQEAYDLPGGDLLPWIASGFRGGVCLGEICGTLSGAVIAMGLMAYKVLEPKTSFEQKILCQAITPYIRDLAYAFNRTFGSIHCDVLTRRQEGTPEEREIHNRLRLTKQICFPFVDFVVRTMVNWGEISQEPGLPGVIPALKLG